MRRVTLLTNPDVCNLHCPLCFLNQRVLRICDVGESYDEPRLDNGRNSLDSDEGRNARGGFGVLGRSGSQGHRAFGMGEMPIEIAIAAIEKYAAERDSLGKRLLQEVIPSTMGEPLLYSHFDELLERCRTLGIPLNLTTNGTFPGKWGGEISMETLLLSCCDIKVSYLASEQFEGWKANVEKLVKMRNRLRGDADGVETADARVSTVSLQVTLHKKNLHEIPDLVEWASAIGIDRIKWNKVVVLRDAPIGLKLEYVLDRGNDEMRKLILNASQMCCSDMKNEGSIFMNVSHNCFSLALGTCPFTDEVWIMPDGSEDYCPSPERRYGDKNAKCCFIEF